MISRTEFLGKRFPLKHENGLYKGSEMMIIQQYDEVLLKDGREAAIVEVFSDRDFLADVGSSEKDWETIDITVDDIEKVLRRH